MRVEWTPLARSDLEDILRHIAQDNIDAAFRQADRIESMAVRLSVHPLMGRVGRLPGSRELVVTGTPYLVIYRSDLERVEILRVVHGSRAWPPEA